MQNYVFTYDNDMLAHTHDFKVCDNIQMLSYVFAFVDYTLCSMLRKSPDEKWSTRFAEFLRKYFN